MSVPGQELDKTLATMPGYTPLADLPVGLDNERDLSPDAPAANLGAINDRNMSREAIAGEGLAKVEASLQVIKKMEAQQDGKQAAPDPGNPSLTGKFGLAALGAATGPLTNAFLTSTAGPAVATAANAVSVLGIGGLAIAAATTYFMSPSEPRNAGSGSDKKSGSKDNDESGYVRNVEVYVPGTKDHAAHVARTAASMSVKADVDAYRAGRNGLLGSAGMTERTASEIRSTSFAKGELDTPVNLRKQFEQQQALYTLQLTENAPRIQHSLDIRKEKGVPLDSRTADAAMSQRDFRPDQDFRQTGENKGLVFNI